jgi:hypothetical protein
MSEGQRNCLKVIHTAYRVAGNNPEKMGVEGITDEGADACGRRMKKGFAK